MWNANICTFYMVTFLLLRGGIVPEDNFCNMDYVLYCCSIYIYILVNMITESAPVFSSEHC